MPPSSDRPYPPLHLIDRVLAISGRSSDPIRAYEEFGAQTKRAVVSLLGDDWSFEGKRVLDFGSGAGRTLRHFLTEAEQGEFWGADIDEPSIAWLQEHLSPPLHGWHCGAWPPLGIEHGTFDLIYTVSVFTHLTDNYTPMALELHRLLKPGGLLIVSYMGRWNSDRLAKEPWDEDRIGRNVLYADQPWDLGGPVVLTSDWWFREHWGRAFDIVGMTEQTHDMTWALLRKRDVELTTEEFDRPSDDPRELAALRHNVTQVRMEVREQAARAEALRAAEREAYEERIATLERSLSWKLTAPLRAGARRARQRADRS